MQHLMKETYVAVGNVIRPSLVKDLWDALTTLYSPTGITGQYEAFVKALNTCIVDPSEYHCQDIEDIPAQINKLMNTFYEMLSKINPKFKWFRLELSVFNSSAKQFQPSGLGTICSGPPSEIPTPLLKAEALEPLKVHCLYDP
ncbi:hypothetical protein HD554DRAFT_2174189 [Boletus coccyginus]|nr:hypothetical protein HD554DRAFT_2174189 [Boletus coccyginus]